MYTEDDLLPISALQHLMFCERQWGLIHLEGIWEESRLTAEGRALHEKVDEPDTEVRGDLRTARALRLRSLRFGLAGQADVVEFHRLTETPASAQFADPVGGAQLPGAKGWWRPFPVEYKRGKPKEDRCDEVQLCAQALCLEEMLGTPVPSGALFYGRPRRRLDVLFDADLRGETERLAKRLHALHNGGVTPHAAYEKKCDNCSLVNFCLPKTVGARRSARMYMTGVYRAANREEDEP